MPESISFGAWIRQKRRALDLTQKALADQVGCAEITLRRMEADEYKPSRELALVLFEKLGIPEPERTEWVRFARGLAEYPNNGSSSQTREQKNNLPIPLTSFIGREKEIETVKQLIASHDGSRLLTLTGAGGSGKTRLALEVATKSRDVFRDGVWFIEFAPLVDPALAPQSLLTILGLSEQAGRSPLAIVSDFLQPKRALLILDNCEHLIQACAQLAETLLRACPTLEILATSREALSVAGETLYLVPTLTTPDLAQADLFTISQFEAVRLFVERAQTALPGFRLTADNGSAIARVCHQLDGIPLALELAAARVKALRVEQIAARLAEQEQFRLLTTGTRTALPRHRQLVIFQIDCDDPRTAGEPGRLHRQCTDHAGTDNHSRIAKTHRSNPDGMHRDRNGLDHRRMFKRERLRQLESDVLRNRDILGKCSMPPVLAARHAEDLAVLAQIHLSFAAEDALAARDH